MTVIANVVDVRSTWAAPALLAQVRRPGASYVSEPYRGWLIQSL